MSQLQQSVPGFFFNLLNLFKPKKSNAELAPSPAWYRANPPKQSTNCAPTPQRAEPEDFFYPFLSLPLEIRRQIYQHILLPPSRTIDLLQSWDYSSAPRIRFRQQGPYTEWTYTEILRANCQIHNEATPMLYEQATLHLRVVSGIREPFPWPALRGLREMAFPHREGDKLYPETLRRFGRVKLTWLLGAEDDQEPDFRDIMYFGAAYGYAPSEMRAGIQGLQDTLGALAAADEEGGEVRSGTAVLPDRQNWILYLDLDWPENVKRVMANEFDQSWEIEGIWKLLVQVGKRRVIRIGRTTDGGTAAPWSEIAKCFEQRNITTSMDDTA